MIVFNFRLQRVLDLRARREQEAASLLSEARTAVDMALDAQTALERVRDQGREQLFASQGVGPTVGHLRNLGFVLDHFEQHVDQARTTVVAAQQNEVRMKDEFTVAFQERHVLDRLRERAREAWQSAEMLADRSAMDDIALMRFGRAGVPANSPS